jgi:RNA polymerase sigma factor FliA
MTTATATTSPRRRGGKHPTPVAQYDCEGRKVAEYPSAKAAALATGVDAANISQGIRLPQRRMGGFLWRRSDGNAPDHIEVPRRYVGPHARPIAMYDLAGHKLAEFRSATIAAEAVGGFASNINHAATGRNRTACGRVWRYTDSDGYLFDEFQRSGDVTARNKLVERHRHLVTYHAERIHAKLPKCVEFGDLTSAGTFGLIEALKRFDPTRNVKFSTFAAPRIYGAIMDSLREQDWVPRLVRRRARSLHEARDVFQSNHGRQPTADELAAALKLSEAEFKLVNDNAREVTVASLETPAGTFQSRGKTMTLCDGLIDTTGTDPADDPNHTSIRDVLLSRVPLREALIVRLYYVDGLTMNEIGEALTLSESRISQMHSRTLATLKGGYGKRLYELLAGRAA